MASNSGETTLKVVPVKRAHMPRYPTRKSSRAPRLDAGSAGRPRVLMVVAVLLGGGAISCPFACVTVCPPVYMSEEDALQVIRDAFAEEGITVVEDPAEQQDFGLPFRIDLAEGERRLAIEYVSKEDCEDFATRYAVEEWSLDDDGAGGPGSSDEDCYYPSDGADRLRRHVEVIDPEIHLGAFGDGESCSKEEARDHLAWEVQNFIESLREQGVL